MLTLKVPYALQATTVLHLIAHCGLKDIAYHSVGSETALAACTRTRVLMPSVVNYLFTDWLIHLG